MLRVSIAHGAGHRRSRSPRRLPHLAPGCYCSSCSLSLSLPPTLPLLLALFPPDLLPSPCRAFSIVTRNMKPALPRAPPGWQSGTPTGTASPRSGSGPRARPTLSSARRLRARRQNRQFVDCLLPISALCTFTRHPSLPVSGAPSPVPATEVCRPWLALCALVVALQYHCDTTVMPL